LQRHAEHDKRRTVEDGAGILAAYVCFRTLTQIGDC